MKQFQGLRSMRYQQVYNASLFTNLGSEFIYVTTIWFSLSPNGIGSQPSADPWTITNMQINLSTTSRSADGLSAILSDNVGTDDMVVLGPTNYNFPGGFPGDRQVIFLSTPFRYNPAIGNLLVDVRIFNGAGPLDTHNPAPSFTAYDSPSDEISRVWSTNVASTVADGIDTVGLLSLIQLDPIPSLNAYTSFFGTPTNYIAIEWPTQPTVFVLQSTHDMFNPSGWQDVNTSGVFSNEFFQRYYFPAQSAGSGQFYRLVWPGGQ
ncbi:MAG TPA: hypothetical protein VG146_09245 [Verrucomicrobiae bacterium]|nr:hypothetical protein [Verrucomicrobiae bacterium]